MSDKKRGETPKHSQEDNSPSVSNSDWRIHKCWFRHPWFRKIYSKKSIFFTTFTKSIESLNLSENIILTLKEHGVNTLGDLVSRSEYEISNIPDIGDIHVPMIIQRFKEVVDEASGFQSKISSHKASYKDSKVEKEKSVFSKRILLRIPVSQPKRHESRRKTAVQTIGQCLWKEFRGIIHQKDFEKIKGESVFIFQWSPKLITFFKDQGISSIGELMQKFEKDFLLYLVNANEELIEVYTKLRFLLRTPEVLKTPTPIEDYNFQLDSDILKILVDSTIKKLPERKKMIITRRFGLWVGAADSLIQLGQELGLSGERVRQLERDIIKDLNTPAIRRKVVKSIIKLCEEVLTPYLLNHWGIASKSKLFNEVLNLRASPAINELACNFICKAFFPGKSFFVVSFRECGDDVYALDNKIADTYEKITFNTKHHLRGLLHSQTLESIILYLQKADPSVSDSNPAFISRCLKLCKNIDQDPKGNFLYQVTKASTSKEK